VTGNGLAMTAFLWHLSAAFAVMGVATARGWNAGVAGTGGWWLTRPLWLGAAALLTAVLIAVFRRFDAPRPAVIEGGPGGLAALGVTLCTAGIFGLSTVVSADCSTAEPPP
jgi:hypothetical protein